MSSTFNEIVTNNERPLSNNYDIILVLEFFRLAAPYLSIIKYLSSEFRIGLYLVTSDQALLDKNGETHKKFIERCFEFGAEIVMESHVECAVLIIQQRPYSNETADAINKNINAKIRIGYLTLAMAGVEIHDNFLQQFDIKKVFVPDKKFFTYLLNARNAQDRYKNIEIVEVGLPFKKYPVYKDFEVDYIIAAPTGFSFHSESDKHIFFLNVLSLLDRINSNAIVAYKQHNADIRDYFCKRGYSELSKFIVNIPGINVFIHQILKNKIKLPKFLDLLITSILYKTMIRRTIHMDEMTEDSDFALELFLPGVKCGVIGGLSNTIWSTKYFNLNFYNCVDDTIQDRNRVNYLLNKDSRGFLDLNLGYFYTPCCHGDLTIYKGKISDGNGEVTTGLDLIDHIRRIIG